jgi:hypothetical protein
MAQDQPTKILLALQFWKGDRDQAMRVARLIADLEPRHSEFADFLFVSRFDCEQDISTIEYVSTKFNTHTYVNRHRRGTGWPHGCNDLWFGTMDHVYSFSEAKRFPPYKAVLTFEADACPLVPNWHRELSRLWDQHATPKGVKMFGAKVEYPLPHINGNAMFSGDLKFLYWISRLIGGCDPTKGWDFILAKDFKREGWADCPMMKSHWQKKTMPDEEIEALRSAGIVFLHGVKDDSVISHMRKKFVGG